MTDTLCRTPSRFAASSAKMPRLPHPIDITEDSVRSPAAGDRLRRVGSRHQRVDPRTDWHRIICPGPFFCGMVRGMRRGDYLEVEGELRGQEQPRTVVVAGESHWSANPTMPSMRSAFSGWTGPTRWSISARTANAVRRLLRGEADASPLFF